MLCLCICVHVSVPVRKRMCGSLFVWVLNVGVCDPMDVRNEDRRRSTAMRGIFLRIRTSNLLLVDCSILDFFVSLSNCGVNILLVDVCFLENPCLSSMFST